MNVEVLIDLFLDVGEKPTISTINFYLTFETINDRINFRVYYFKFFFHLE